MIALRVLLLQLPVPNNPATNVPLAAGYLKAYAHAQGLLEQVTIDILPRALADYAGDALLVDSIVERAPDLLGISLYTWNSERSLQIAAAVKARLPQLLVVVGGPEVQPDNDWVLQHPAVDLAVVGEGEQTFAELLRLLVAQRHQESTQIPLTTWPAGLVFRNHNGELIQAAERVALSDLSGIPSPYLLGYLEIDPDALLMVEVSRWCPYACSFCLYGRNMGPKLGNRYFPLERLLAEIAWGRERGATRVHFIEANLNLVPLFQPLMRALADLNADGCMAFYAELRGEHLGDEAVAALAQAGLRVAEVGLQTANPIALRAAKRKTDLQKWAAGTRRLYAHNVEVLLDVIVGLPADSAQGVQQTLEFIEREQLGPYDAFTLQVLPGTAVRHDALQYALEYQDRPPYYVLGTDQLPYTELRRLRRELKLGTQLDPDAVEGCPLPHLDALSRNLQGIEQPVTHLRVCGTGPLLCDVAAIDVIAQRLAAHVTIVADQVPLPQLSLLFEQCIRQNPSSLLDLYLCTDEPPTPATLIGWRTALPFEPGYLDRVAVYRRTTADIQYDRVSPRIWLVLPWSSQVDAQEYTGIASIIWAYDLAAGEEPPFAAWERAGGAGILVCGRTAEEIETWRTQISLLLF